MANVQAAITPEDRYVWALCVWREARGDGEAGMTAVAWTIWNRLQSGRWGNTIHDVVEDRLQFSSMTVLGDPETILWPNIHRGDADLEAWAFAKQIVERIEMDATQQFDPTHGAMFYFAKTIAKPKWAETMTPTAIIGKQEFFRG